MDAFQIAWNTCDEDKLINQFSFMYSVWSKVLEVRGSNQFKNPHNGQRRNLREGLPVNIVLINGEPMTRQYFDDLKNTVNNYYGGILI